MAILYIADAMARNIEIKARVSDLMTRLGILEADLVDQAYVDLLEPASA